MKEHQSEWDTIQDKFSKLENEVTCDILIVGGGLAGLLCAYALTERGYEVSLLEAEKIASGVTQNTTATITSQQGLIYVEIAKKYSLSQAKVYFDAQEQGILLYEKLIKKHQINCGFKKLNGYFYAEGDNQNLKKEFAILKEMKASVEYIEELPNIDLAVTGAIKQSNQAQFDVIQFINGLPKKFQIYEQSRVREIDLKNKIAFSDRGCVRYQKIVLATHYPILNKIQLNFTKMYQSMSYAVSFRQCKDLGGIFNDDKENGITLRNHLDLLIVGGADHRTGRKNNEKHFEKLINFAKQIYPACKIEKMWASEDCVTFDHIPIVGKVDEKNSVYMITGFNKWGMSNSILSAYLICDLIEGKQNSYAELFSPSRKYVRQNLVDYLIGAGVAALNIMKSYLTMPMKDVKKLQQGTAGIFLIRGKRRAVYKNENGKLFIISARCPHMGCQLVFNPETTSWDCPCHGSRFDVYGKIITEPSVKEIGIAPDIEK